MIRQLQDPGNEAHADFQRKTRQVVRLPTDQLVGALNEHVSELVVVPCAPCIECFFVLVGSVGKLG
jgi:hypothetical protein